MPISWLKTFEAFGTNESNTTTRMKVVIECDGCRKEAQRLLCSVKQGMKRNGGKYLCHDCATKTNKFKDECSKRAKTKWEDPEYRKNNLTVVRSDEYREKKRDESLKRWEDPEFKAFMTSPEMKAMRAKNSSFAAKEKWKDPVYRNKLILRLRERMVRQWRDDDYRTHMINNISERSTQMWSDGVFGGVFDDEFRQKMAGINAEILSRPDVLQKLSEASKKNWENEEYRDAVIVGNKEKWEEPEYREKMAVIRANQPRISSLQHMLYKYLADLGVIFCEEGDETAVGYYAFDCLVPKQNEMHKALLIECQGDYWHSLAKTQTRDRAKFTYADRYFPEYEIMYLWEHEFHTDGRVLDRLKLKLGLDIQTADFSFDDVRIIDDLEAKDVRGFLDAYHYIGRGRGGITVGAKYGDELVAVVVFSPPLRQNQDSYGEFRELSRFCIHPSYHKKNFASWLLARFLKFVKDVPTIIAYSDATVGHLGTIYKASNFTFHHEVQPDYWYVDNDGYVMHKRTLYGRASKMKMKEAEFAEKYGYVKKFGGPKRCFVLRK